MTEQTERAAIVAWARNAADATETTYNSIALRITESERQAWRDLARAQRAMADAIERGDHMKGQPDD